MKETRNKSRQQNKFEPMLPPVEEASSAHEREVSCGYGTIVARRYALVSLDKEGEGQLLTG